MIPRLYAPRKFRFDGGPAHGRTMVGTFRLGDKVHVPMIDGRATYQFRDKQVPVLTHIETEYRSPW